MEDKELWTTFEKTGSVLDYLNYKGVCREEHSGERTVESDSHGDRDGTVHGTYWGI